MRTAKTADNAATLRGKTQPVNTGNEKSCRASKQATPALPPPSNTAPVPRSPVPPPPLPPGLQPVLTSLIVRPPAATPTLDLPPGVMPGAIILGELLDHSQAMPFCAAVSYLEGVRLLMEHHPDLRVYADALTLVCTGEQKLQELRSIKDELLDTALETRLDRALPLLDKRLVEFSGDSTTRRVYLDALADVKDGLKVLDGLRAQLAAL